MVGDGGAASHLRANWHRVLVVDNGSILLGALGAALNRRGYEVHAIPADADTAVLPSAIAEHHPDVVLVDEVVLSQWGPSPAAGQTRQAPQYLVLRPGDQPTNSEELCDNLQRGVTVCTPADIHTLLP